MMLTTASALTLFTIAVALWAGVMDVYTRRVPNWLTLPAAVVLLILQFVMGGAHALGHAALAMLVAGGVFLLFFIAGGMGGGDVKLMAALSAGIGLQDTGALLMLTALAGGAMAMVLAMRHGQLRRSFANVGTLAMHHCYSGLEPHPEMHVRNPRTLRLPYAVAIAAGTLLTIFLKGIEG
jgi:prepilin peptidase CpaA